MVTLGPGAMITKLSLQVGQIRTWYFKSSYSKEDINEQFHMAFPFHGQ